MPQDATSPGGEGSPTSSPPNALPTAFQRDGLPTAVLDVHEAAAYLAVSEVTLRRLVARGEVPHTRVGRALRFRVRDLEDYLAARTSRTWRPHKGE